MFRQAPPRDFDLPHLSYPYLVTIHNLIDTEPRGYENRTFIRSQRVKGHTERTARTEIYTEVARAG